MKIKGIRIRGREDLRALLKSEVPEINESELEVYTSSLQALLLVGKGLLFGHYQGTREEIEHYIEGVKKIYQKRKTQTHDSQPSIDEMIESLEGMPEIIYMGPF